MADNNKTDSDIIDVTPEKVAEEEKPAAADAGDSGHSTKGQSTDGQTNGQTKKRRNPWWVLAPMFLLGALLVLGVAFSQDLIAWYKGRPTPPNSYLAPTADEASGLTELESQLAALQGRVAALEDAANGTEQTNVEQRLSALEDLTQTSLYQASTNDGDAGVGADPAALAELQAQVSALVADQAGLAQDMADIRTSLNQINQSSAADPRVDTLTAEVDALQQRLDKQAGQVDMIAGGTIPGVQEGLMTLAMTRLRQTIIDGSAFVEERAAVESLVAAQDQISFEAIDALRALTDYEAEGVATIEELKAGFAAAASTFAPPEIEDPDAEWWEEVWDDLTAGIKITRPGEDTPVVNNPVADIAALVAQHRLADAIAGIEQLPVEDQTAFADWVTMAANRLAADDALALLEQSMRGDIQ